MSESAQHRQLVQLVMEEACGIVGPSNRCFLQSDTVEGGALPALTEEGVRPDVFYQHDGLMIIGEAKTSDDIARAHSRLQYESYLKKCSVFRGKALFLIAVPWTEHAAVHNILQKLRAKYPGEYLIRILDGIGGAI